jgi:malyl-CoA/(S)-citramalyl-CoA lyase
VRNPRDFGKPLAIGAPDPILEVPFKPSRMIHFFDPSNEKMAAKLPDLAAKSDILLGNLEDAVPVDRKQAALEGLVKVGREVDLGGTSLWTRVNALESPWILDELTTLVTEIGDTLEVVMVPRSRAPGTSITSTGCWPSSRPRPAFSARSSSTLCSRPASVWSTSRRSPPPARGCRG